MSSEIPSEIPGDVTRLLLELKDGRSDAIDELLPLILAQLRRMAHQALAGQRQGLTLQTTDMVSLAYLKLFKDVPPHLKSSSHLLAVISKAMRQILIDHARSRGCDKRKSDAQAGAAGALDEIVQDLEQDSVSLLDLEEALQRLEASDPKLVKLIELRFFAGFEMDEIALALEVPLRTLERDWAFARAWLWKELK